MVVGPTIVLHVSDNGEDSELVVFDEVWHECFPCLGGLL